MSRKQPTKRSWKQRLHGSFEYPGVNFPPDGGFPLVRLTVEASERPARCRICSNPIAGGEKRIMAYARQRKIFPGGGTSSGQIYQYHRFCMIKAFGARPKERDPALCFCCGKRHGHHPLQISNWVPYGKICEECLNDHDNSYARCDGCKAVHKTSQLQIAEQGATLNDYWDEKNRPIGGKPVCGPCVVNFNLPTTKNRKQRDRDLNRYAQMVERIHDRLDTWLGEDGEAGSPEDHLGVPGDEVPADLMERFRKSAPLSMDQVQQLF
jgi:hypothetical protein